MTYTFEILTSIGIYAFALIAIGTYLSLKENKQDFIIGGRSIGALPTAASMAASFRDGGGIAFWIGMGLAGGYGGLWLFVGFALASIFIGLYSKKLRDSAARANHLTINETVESRVGKRSTYISTIISLVFCFCNIALQFFVSGALLAVILDQPHWIGTATIALLLIIYMVLGGYKSVIATDTLQFFLIISLIFAPLFISIDTTDFGNVGSLITFPTDDKFAFTIFGAFLFLSLPEAWQRVYSAKNAKAIYWALPLTTTFLVIMTVSLIWMGMGLRSAPESVSGQHTETYLMLFDPVLNISPWFLGYLAMVFVSITMSTQSSACYTFTSTLNRIFIHRKKETTDEEYIWLTRWQTSALLFFTALISLSFNDVIQTLWDIISFFICLAPLYMVTVVNPVWLKEWKSRDQKLSTITVLGIVLYLYLFFTGKTEESFLLSVMPAVLTAALVGVTCLYVQKRHKNKGKKKKK